MTKDAFVAAIATEPNFLKWVQIPVLIETIGDVEKWHGIVYRSTLDGTNTEHVYFMVDKATGDATWQTQNTLSTVKNTNEARIDKLEKYLKQNFFAYRVVFVDPDNFWAEAEVYTDGVDLTKSKVLVYKAGANPITHKKVV